MAIIPSPIHPIPAAIKLFLNVFFIVPTSLPAG